MLARIILVEASLSEQIISLVKIKLRMMPLSQISKGKSVEKFNFFICNYFIML